MSLPAEAQLLRTCGIAKSFPGVQALAGVDFDLLAGEVHALVGENGAGKSTLTRIIAGAERADAGEMFLSGGPYRPRNRADAGAQGIRMVMQELNLVGNLSIAENIYLERLPSTLGVVRYKSLNDRARQIMQEVGLGQIDPRTLVSRLGVGQQQMVEIAAGLSRRCRVLAFDEPTASLTDKEIELLFAQINRLKADGVGIIYISHRIEEVVRIADRITVLRDGKLVATRPAKALSVDEIIRLMVGRELKHEQAKRDQQRAAVALRVVGLGLGQKVRGVSFEVKRGEILGVAGLMGSGRTETMRAIFGADKPQSGQIFLRGSDSPTKIRSPRDAVRNGIALLTEDRKGQGLLLPLAVRANVSLARLRAVSRGWWIVRSQERAVAQRYIRQLDIKCSSEEQPVMQLSGGNQQKVVIGKWLYRDCDVLIFDEPTRGIDVGAKFEIYRMLADLADKGRALIVVSSDLNELMAISDRIMVMSAGRVAGVFDRGNYSEERIMTAAFSGYITMSAG
jgi:ribose transport system ATP-binding protein